MQHSSSHPGQCEKVDGELPHSPQWAPINMGRTALAAEETQDSDMTRPYVFVCIYQDRVSALADLELAA